MGDAEDKENNEQNEKALEKKKLAEWRKMAKQLKAKDAQTKLAAIAKCGDNVESLSRGECLVPLLQLCVAKKKNAPIVTAAVGVVRGFLRKTADGDHAHARVTFEAAEKKKNRLPGGKLFTDLLGHESLEIVGAGHLR